MSAQVEMALEEGDLTTARRMLAEARANFPQAEGLDRLSRQIDEVDQLAAQPAVNELVQRAQEKIRVADYQGALEPLGLALELRPGDAHLEAMRQRTEKAAQRHAQAVERQQAAASAAREISRLLDAGDLQTARERLRTARGEHGRQKILDDLEARLISRIEQVQGERAEEHLERAHRAAREEDWQGALHQAELALTLTPGDQAAEQLRTRALSKIEDAEHRQQRDALLEEARLDVERLITAGEMARADERLHQAIDALGREPLFEELAERIDKAKKDREFRRRIEWRERRAKEAESLVQEATRRSLGGDFAAAVEKLEAARELDPSYPDLEAKLATHRQARARQVESERHATELDTAVGEIRHHLDALRLDQAAAALREARQQFGDEKRFAPLAARLSGLREAETTASAAVLPTPENLPSLGLAARKAIRRREAAVASVYSWRQAFLLPTRGTGPLLLLALAAVLAAGHAGAHFFAAFDLLAWAAALVVVPSVVRVTLEGKNQPPPLGALWRGGASVRDGATLALLVAVAALPALLLVATRQMHGLFAGPVGWLLLALLLWLAAAAVTGWTGVALTFGLRRVTRLDTLAEGGGALLALACAVFAAACAALLLRAVLVPVMGVPLAALLESYALLALAHLVGVMVRSRRLAWTERYV